MKKQRLSERVFTIRVPNEIAGRIEAIAASEYETPSTIVRRLIRRGLAKLENADNTEGSGVASHV